MLLKSLRTNIALNIVVLLLIAMLLVDLVSLMVSHKMFIASRLEKGHVVMTALMSHLQAVSSNATETWRIPEPRKIDQLMNVAGGLCLVAVSDADRMIHRAGFECSRHAALETMARKAAQTGREIIQTSDFFSGIFGRQPGILLLAMPLMVDGKVVGGGSLSMSLDDIFSQMRRSQHIILVYVLINAVILGFLGVYRLNRITVKPIQRLVRRAEAYRDSDDSVFLIDKEDTEFSQLSKSLNRMLMQLTEDKEKLQHTIASLEEANGELEKAQRDLVRAEKLASVGRLSAGIAHEIGNPIGIIKGYLSLLNDPSIPEAEKADFVQRTESEVERIQSIIQQLLDFARPSGEEQEVVAVHAILKDLEDVCRFQPVLTCIQFELRLNASRDQVMANARQLRQVFLNLVLNAADAVREISDEGVLIIQTENRPSSPRSSKPEGLEIRFMDNGPGVPGEALGNIFDPFFTTKEPGKGTGLGLSVSFTIVEGLGGSIKAESNAEGGTSMTIMLPLAAEPTN
jgi:two-component system, NtrC family, sensor kinase